MNHPIWDAIWKHNGPDQRQAPPATSASSADSQPASALTADGPENTQESTELGPPPPSSNRQQHTLTAGHDGNQGSAGNPMKR